MVLENGMEALKLCQNKSAVTVNRKREKRGGGIVSKAQMCVCVCARFVSCTFGRERKKKRYARQAGARYHNIIIIVL